MERNSVTFANTEQFAILNGKTVYAHTKVSPVFGESPLQAAQLLYQEGTEIQEFLQRWITLKEKELKEKELEDERQTDTER